MSTVAVSLPAGQWVLVHTAAANSVVLGFTNGSDVPVLIAHQAGADAAPSNADIGFEGRIPLRGSHPNSPAYLGLTVAVGERIYARTQFPYSAGALNFTA